jgi:tetratricopeptide (TPR) repeat protein
MKRRSLLVLGLLIATPFPSFAQSGASPVTRTEILGRLALDYSPSYIAHLVKIRGVDFSMDDHFLTVVDLAGGTGILHQRLPSAQNKSSSFLHSDSDAPYDHLGKCAEFFKLGYPEKAEPECRSSMDENPRSPWPVLAALRAIHSGHDEVPDAEALARRAVGLGPDLPETHYQLSINADRNHVSAEESMSELQKMSALSSEDHDPLFHLSYESGGVPGGFSQNDLAHAAETGARLRQRIAADPDVADTHSSASYFYQAMSQPDRAILETRKALELEPDNPDSHQRLANLLGGEGDSESEISELRAAVRCQPYEISRRISLAERLQALGRSSESLKEFDDLIKTKPADWDANNQVTYFLVQHEMVPAAIADIRIFLKATADGQVEGNFPQTAEGIRSERQEYLARLLRSNGERDAAAAEYRELFDRTIDEFRKALAANPGDQRTRAALGMAYANKGDITSAISEIKQAIRQDESVPELHVLLARVYSLNKDEVAALSELKRVLELQPENAEAENEIAWLLVTASNQKLRDPQSSLQHAMHAVSLLENSPQASSEETAAFLDTLAEAQLQTGHPAEALTTEQSAAKLAPNNAEIQSRLQRFLDAANPKSATVPQ